MGAQTTSEPADLTPSEVALARVLAAWEAWPGDDGSPAGNIIYQIGDIVFLGGWVETGYLTPAGHYLLARARKAGVL